MKIKFNVNTKIRNEETIKQAKLVLFRSMLKMQELATINAPFDTGNLSRKINLIPQVEGHSNYILTAATEYAEAVEFGTDPHVIKVKNKKVLANKKKGIIFGKTVMHPGTEAQPYMRPALDQVQDIWVKRYWERTLSR